MHKARSQQSGFTIVELLVVIVVIGILAAITVVAYTGINQKAIVASLQSDLTSSSRRLKLYYIDNGAYPASLDGSNCPTGPADSRYCLKPSQGNSYTYNSPGAHSGFSLTATNGSTAWRITENSAPGEVAPITAIAAIAGTPQDGSVLTSGALTPSGATATYQWQSAATSGGAYTDISGATSSTYTPVSGDVGRFIKVVATGSNSYYGTVTSVATTVVLMNPWIAGLGGTAMAGKFVRNADLGGMDQYKTSTSAVTAPQGATGLDPSYPSNMSLVNPQTNPGVDFSAYPAQNACKAIGGRLPNMQELNAIYAGSVTYGNNFQAYFYWSSTEYGGIYAYHVYFVNGSTDGYGKTGTSYVRCVSG